MQSSLTSIFSLEIDPREAALRETEDAIGVVLSSSEAGRAVAPERLHPAAPAPDGRAGQPRVALARARAVPPGPALSGRGPQLPGGDPAGSPLEFLGHSTVLIDLDGVRIADRPGHACPGRSVAPGRACPRSATDLRTSTRCSSRTSTGTTSTCRRCATSAATPIFVPAGSGDWLRGAGFDDVRELGRRPCVTSGGSASRPCRPSTPGYRPRSGPTVAAARLRDPWSRTIYFAGDTDLFAGMAELPPADRRRADPGLGLGSDAGSGLHLDPLRAAEALRLIRPRVAVPIHWGTYWPHALGRVYPERLVEPPAAFAEHASELAPDVRALPRAVGDP